MTEDEGREVQRADPASRRRAVVAAAIVAILGWAAFFVLQAWLAGLEELDRPRMREALEQALILGTWTAMLPVGALAIWLWRLGGRVRSAGRHPPPGARVIRDTPVLRGESARLRGTLFLVLAVFLALLGAGTVLAAHRLVAKLAA